MSKRIIAIDPGRTTGVVIGTVGSQTNPTELQLLEAFEIHWPNRLTAVDALFGNMLIGSPIPAVTVEAVVIESFHLYAHKAKEQIGNEFPSVRVIGYVEMLCWQYHIDHLITFQGASEISRVQILKEHEQHLHSEHMKDAYKHFRLWCVKHKGVR